ncbi:MAG TPA: hypothetical protein VN827_04345 [Chthoniobacterales bacterium]|jgi:hypothetical protein|nr:hypothetical protein [Chthoniobacterales bacterium]
MWPFTKWSRIQRELDDARKEFDTLKVLAAQPLVQNVRANKLFSSLHEAEFKVFSQFGDDGIIQYLIHRLQPLPDSFVEFGVENYRESNTRFLLLNNNWRGLVMDGDKDSIRYVKKDDISWRHTLAARCAFIHRDNINDLLTEAGFTGEIGLLSIDIDGIDYWVWEKLKVIDPVVVVAEYNSIFGPDLAVTIPYDPNFVRHQAHYSGQFWGASLTALALLAGRKGYSLLGCNSAGNNAYFVRTNKLGQLPVFSAREAFVDARFRDSRSPSGKLTHLSGRHRFEQIAHLEVYDVERAIQAPLNSFEQK